MSAEREVVGKGEGGGTAGCAIGKTKPTNGRLEGEEGKGGTPYLTRKQKDRLSQEREKT